MIGLFFKKEIHKYWFFYTVLCRRVLLSTTGLKMGGGGSAGNQVRNLVTTVFFAL